MKKIIMMVIVSFVILMGSSLFACGSGDSSCGSSNNTSSCNASSNDSACSCVDPSCGWTWEHNCTSQSMCCEAFGNIAGDE